MITFKTRMKEDALKVYIEDNRNHIDIDILIKSMMCEVFDCFGTVPFEMVISNSEKIISEIYNAFGEDDYEFMDILMDKLLEAPIVSLGIDIKDDYWEFDSVLDIDIHNLIEQYK